MSEQPQQQAGTTPEGCGACALCCKLMEIQELPDKPKGKWCQYADRGNSAGCCTIYDSRPLACKMFRCLWLESQEVASSSLGMLKPLSPEAKPSKSGVVLIRQQYQPHKALFALCDPRHPMAFMNEPINTYLLQASADNWAVVAGFGTDLYSILLGRFFKLTLNKGMLINYGDLALQADGKGKVSIAFPKPKPDVLPVYNANRDVTANDD